MPKTMPPDLEADIASPLARLRAIRAYANRVFDDEARAATWLSRANESVRGGLCAVGAACQDTEGYREAISELSRLERQLEQHGYYVHKAAVAPSVRQPAVQAVR